MIAVRREGGWKGGGVFSGWFDDSWCSMDNHSGFSKLRGYKGLPEVKNV